MEDFAGAEILRCLDLIVDGLLTLVQESLAHFEQFLPREDMLAIYDVAWFVADASNFEQLQSL